MAPKLSVVIPFYGVEAYIGECLDSVLDQTFTDFDCVLVDDGSPDGTAAVAATYCERDSRIRIHTQENQGLGPARNSGAAQTHGEYLMFLDSDDIISPRCFEQLITSLDRTGSDFAAANVWRWDLRRGVEFSRLHELAFRRHLERTTIFETPDLVDDRTAWNKMFRRSWYDEHDWRFPAIKFEDYPVTLPMHLAATAVDLLPDPVYVWRERESGDSISQQSVKMGAVRDRVTAALMVCDAVAQHGNAEIRRRTYWHLLTVDILEVLTARRHASPADLPEIDRLARKLARRFDAELMRAGERPSLMLAVLDTLNAGDVEFAAAVAARKTGAAMTQARAGLKITPKRTQLTAPLVVTKARKILGVREPASPRLIDHGNLLPRLPDPKLPGRFLKAIAVIESSGDGWRLTLEPVLRPEIANRLTYRLRIGGRSWPANPVPGDRLQVTTTVPTSEIEAELIGVTPVVLEGRLGPLTWAGTIQPSQDTPVAPKRLPSGAYAQFQHVHLGHKPRRPGLVLSRIEAERVTENLQLTETGLKITHPDRLSLIRPFPEEPVKGRRRLGVTTWPWTALLDPIDEPVNRTATRPIVADGRPLYYAGDLAATATVAGRTFGLTRLPDGQLALTYLDFQEKCAASPKDH